MSNNTASPDQLEREIFETRAEIERKLTLLQHRLSPRSVANSMGAQGGAFARNLGTALRDNPVPALLLGVGICWLMLSGRPNGRADVMDDEWDDDIDALSPGEPSSMAPRTAAAMAAVEGGRSGHGESDRAERDAAALGLTAGRR